MSTALEHVTHLRRRGPRSECATLGWNMVASGLVLAAAVSARSVAPAGFGLDPLIEIAAGYARAGTPSTRRSRRR